MRRARLLVSYLIVHALAGGVIRSSACPGDCCQSAGEEAYYACMEFELILPELDCDAWRTKGVEVCLEECSDCRAISRSLKVLCEKMLRAKVGAAQIAEQCQFSMHAYETFRCASVCQLSYVECATDEAIACRHCGNWQKCNCYLPFGDDINRCVGESLLPGVKHSCGRMPVECHSHRDGLCGRYKWCQQDLCFLENIVCPLTSACHRTMTCVPASGECAPSSQPDGYPCDTGLSYTLQDSGQCKRGECIGTTNFCCKHRVKCETTNPCMASSCDPLTQKCTCAGCKAADNSTFACDPLCDPESGFCHFEPKPDGSPCTTNRPWIQGEQCWNGMCLGTEHNLCGANCSAPPQCRAAGVCNPMTGNCYYPPLDDGACDDNSEQTHHDVCIEGYCRSSFFDTPEYLFVGYGTCADSKQRTVNTLMKLDIREVECQTVCTRDVACEAYSWAIFAHTCILYTRLRDAPRAGWEMSRTRFDIVSEITTAIPLTGDEPVASCYRKVEDAEPVSRGMSGTVQFWLLLVAVCVCWLLVYSFWNRKKIRKIWEYLDSDLDLSGYANASKSHPKRSGRFSLDPMRMFRRNRKIYVQETAKVEANRGRREPEQIMVEDVSDITENDELRLTKTLAFSEQTASRPVENAEQIEPTVSRPKNEEHAESPASRPDEIEELTEPTVSNPDGNAVYVATATQGMAVEDIDM